jgi:transposase-like protein
MRRPRDWGHPCPHAECPLFKRMGRSAVSAVSTYMTESGKRRIFRCQRCKTTFSDTRDTVCFDLRTSAEKVMMALKMRLVRVDLSGISFVHGVHEETVLAWLGRATAKAHEINEPLLRNLVWLKNSAASRRVAIVIPQQPTQALSTLHLTAVTPKVCVRGNELVNEALVIPLRMIMAQVLLDGIRQGAFTQHDHLAQEPPP